MKKLMVLAVLSAMAIGAKAEYTYTLDLDGAKAVYASAYITVESDRNWAVNFWNEGNIADTSEEFTKLVTDNFGSFADYYQFYEGISSEDKFGGGEGSFSHSSNGYKTWTLLVLTDATEISPGAAYSVYYGTSGKEGGAITLDTTPIASGYLRTDSPTPAPEPTSGLLMLLGVAGLALRRRRA